MKGFCSPGARLLLFGLILAAAGFASAQSRDRYSELRQKAADYYSEQSYALAHETWTEAAKFDVPDADRPTLEFYLADSLWRSRPPAAQVTEARAMLGKLAGAGNALAAEATESLGDSWLALENDWNRAWTEYRRALKFWAASTDLDAARGRYLGIVWKATGPPRAVVDERRVPSDVLENALRIAPNAEEQARAHYFLGCQLSGEGGAFALRRAGREFQAAVEAGGDTAVYESALFRLARWNLVAGRASWRDGQLNLEPDYDRALELFQRFASEYSKGRSAYGGEVAAEIAILTASALNLRVDEQFLPGERPRASASWRNVGAVQFTLTRVDLLKNFQPAPRTDPARWLEAVRAVDGTVVRQWTDGGLPSGGHAPQEKQITLEPVTESGTYLLEARGGGLRARALVIVTEAAAAFQSAGSQVAAFFCEARSGDRAKDVKARLWRVRSVEDRWEWREGVTDGGSEGMVKFALPPPKTDAVGTIVLVGQSGGQPVVASGSEGGDASADGWRLQVFTDRAAYRPEDTVRWKVIARKRDGGAFKTPGGEVLKFVVTDPRGGKVDEGEVKLTPFGGAWGELPLRKDLPLGEYRIAFASGEKPLGEETLFRLEEYRLPEFKVSVEPGDSKRRLRLGDEFDATVAANYYFGGAVADAEVAVEVREEAFARPMPMAAGKTFLPAPSMGGGRVIQRETARTGPDGTITVRVRTAGDSRQDLRYTITARVVDASGRVVESAASVVVGRQSYFVEMQPSRRVARPKEAVAISVDARDGNEHPVAAAGVLTVSRQRWTEVWRDPQGREITGDALDGLKRGIFPPSGQAGWRLIKQEYASEEIARADVVTDASGHGTYVFRPGDAGFYRLAWSGPDGEGPPVTAETNVWVSAGAGGLIGYRAGGVEIITDPSAAAGGGRVPVLVTTDTSQRDVFLTVHAGDSLFRAEVLHLDGNSRLVELDVDPRFVPNVFVTASAVRGGEFFSDTREISFPPVANTLAVELTPAAESVLPGAEGSFRLKVRDAAGRPVRGEFALSVTDEAVSAIEADYAGSPVEFFLAQPRSAGAGPTSSFLGRPLHRESDTAGLAPASVGGRMEKRAGEPQEATMFAASASADEVADKAAPAVTVRTNFSATAFWRPGLLTDEDGFASVKFKYPESLTTWRAVLRGASAGAEFGFAETTTRTTKPLIARLQAPRFLVAGDKVDISAVVNNRTGEAVKAQTTLRAEGLSGSLRDQALRVDPNAEARAVWSLQANDAGPVRLTLTALSTDASDGVETRLEVESNGLEQQAFVAGKTADAESKWSLSLPARRRAGSETLDVRVTPSLAAAALDALPYLISRPAGSVEETMGRFLPAAVTARTLQSLGLDRAVVAGRIFGGIAPEFLSRTHPKNEATAGLQELDAVIADGLARLTAAQQGDGAWSWWPRGEADAFMTAYLLWGLRLAQQAGVAVRSDVLDRAAKWLRLHVVESRDRPDEQAWLIHALSAQHEAGQPVGPEERAALDNLWDQRDRLSAYGRALFALAAMNYGDSERARTLARNLENGVVRDTPGSGLPTVHWGSAGVFRDWQEGGVEATAFSLQALLAIDPGNALVEPAMNWLIQNRRGAQWSNTRDTAIVVLAMSRYLQTTKELGRAVSFDILVNGMKAGEARDVTALLGLSHFEIHRALLRDGLNEIEVKRTSGEGPLYVAAAARFYSEEQPIRAAGNELQVKREYRRYEPRLTLLDGYRFDRSPWALDEAADRNQRIEVVLTVEAANDLEFVAVEDLRPAGLELVSARSGELFQAEGADDRRLAIYGELRDRRMAFFIRRLPAGVWKIRYDLRTETIGEFSALPVVGRAMYAPEIRGNGGSRRVEIR